MSCQNNKDVSKCDVRAQHSVHGVESPSDHRSDGPSESPYPRDGNEGDGFGECQRCAVEPFDDDVVSVSESFFKELVI